MARVDHRRCEKCGYEFTVRSSLAEARRSLLVMEIGRAISACQRCGSRKTVILLTDAFPSERSQERAAAPSQSGRRTTR
jgi:NAD-dependent SIR2 family protein deacetylase